ncbi:MAG: T9SS type A sorting domain-containing protein [Janthinobacterium lividum]
MKLPATLKKAALLLLATLGMRVAQAQTAPDATRQYLDNLVAPLDKSQVPTGFLVEYGVPLVPLDVFNGTLTDSSRTNPDGFRFIYATAYSAWLGSGANPLPSPLDLNASISAAVAANPSAIPVMVQHIDYATVRDDAFSSNLLSYQNNQLFDVAGRFQSPYRTNTLFAAAPATATAPTGDVTLIFPTSLDIERGVGTPMVLNVDFGDGRGYVNTPWNQPVAAHYASAGTWRVKVMVTYTAATRLTPRTSKGGLIVYYPPTEGLSYESQFDLQVASPGTQTASRTARLSASRPGTADDLEVPIAAQSGVHSGALMTIHYATGHTQLLNPFIVVEGYDKNHIAPAVQEQNYDLAAFLTDIETQGGFRFRDALERGGMGTGTGDPYDIVFIDFNNGTDDILRNAVVFEQVLNEVQQRKVGNAANVVMGMSMGGLIARYKLADMRKNGRDSHTRLLILQDSPQRGANVPLGIQALTRQMDFALPIPVVVGSITSGYTVAFRTTDLSPFLKQGITLLDEPATQQMLVHRATDATGGFSANTFLAGTYRSMISGDTDPGRPYQIVAASQGSQCSQYVLSPYTELVRANGEVGVSPLPWIVRGALSAEAIVNALPANGQSNRVSHLAFKVHIRLFRFINITIPLLDRSYSCPAGLLAWDGVAGSTEDLVKDGLTINGSFNTWPAALLFHMPVVDANWHVAVQPKFTFLPTASALDLPITSQAVLDGNRYTNGIGYPSQPAVKSFIAQETFPIGYIPGYGIWGSNKPHLAFTPRNSEWMYDVMQQLPFATSYSDYSCGTADNLAISGTTQLCAGATAPYTVTNLPAGATVQWSLSPNSIVTASGSSTYPFTVQAVASGQVTLQAIVTMPSGNRLTLKSLEVSVGPSQVYIGVYGGCGGLPATLTVNGPNLGTDFRWVIDGQARPQYNGQGQVTYTLPSDPNIASIPVTVTVTGGCPGAGTLSYTIDVGITHAAGCANELTGPSTTLAAKATPVATAALYPNPAHETVDVHVENAMLDQPFTVRIFNSQGQLRIEQASTDAGTMHLKTDRLAPGLYFVHILRGREVLSRQQLKIE